MVSALSPAQFRILSFKVFGKKLSLLVPSFLACLSYLLRATVVQSLCQRFQLSHGRQGSRTKVRPVSYACQCAWGSVQKISPCTPCMAVILGTPFTGPPFQFCTKLDQLSLESHNCSENRSHGSRRRRGRDAISYQKLFPKPWLSTPFRSMWRSTHQLPYCVGSPRASRCPVQLRRVSPRQSVASG